MSMKPHYTGFVLTMTKIGDVPTPWSAFSFVSGLDPTVETVHTCVYVCVRACKDVWMHVPE